MMYIARRQRRDREKEQTMRYVEHVFSREVGTQPHWKNIGGDTLLALGGVTLVTGAIAGAQLFLHIPASSLIYLIAILALASARGLYAAILASLLSVLAFDFFFFPPLYTFAVFKLEDLLTLIVFLATAIITSQLTLALRRRAEEARNREREIRLLYEQAQELAALQERQRLARELHDSVSQALYGISLGAHTVKEALESNDPEQALASIEYVLALAEAGLTEMRALIFELRPESLESEGLVAALTRQAAVLRARHKLAVEQELDGEPDLSLEKKQALYRIAQEALHNIVKHARASAIVLRLIRQANETILEVHDNGRGFDPTGSFPGHLGMHSMRERAMKIGGTLTIKSAPGQETYIRVSVPLAEEREASLIDAHNQI
jgi:signal transduction histidine kinase